MKDVFMNEQDFRTIMKNDATLVNEALEQLYATIDQKHIEKLVEAELYSLMAGGKRIRPIIALAFCRMFGGKDEAALPYACALEMVHTSSLIHDDLPCMDNDTLRRGRPTNHTVYGEAIALLAGDGLLTDSFGVVVDNPHVSAALNVQAVATLADAAGMYGIVGGQYIDMVGETSPLDLETLKKMYSYKTGAMIRASAVMGALAAGVEMADPRMNDVIEYAKCIGLTFQIIDDILDVTGTVEMLGKNPGRDKKEHKTTYLKFFTIDEAFEHATELTNSAIKAISKYDGSDFLVELAKFLLNRKH